MKGRGPAALTARQVDVFLELLVLTAVATGTASLAVGTSWAKGLTIVHGIAGLSVLVLTPAKVRGSVRSGLRRRRATRWLSIGLGLLVLSTIFLGFVHSTGLWFGVGYLTPLWTHVLLAFVVLVVFIWHVASRPGRPKLADLNRRAVLRGSGALALGAAAYGSQEALIRVAGLAGGDRRFSGSHEIASFDPERMPSTVWVNDSAPASTTPEDWRLDVAGEVVAIQALRRSTRPVRAKLDCTGGWYSEQSWDAVPLAEVLPDRTARSIKVTSATGYSRLFPFGDRHDLYLVTGYGGEPLLRRHGAPVRLIAPGRRGVWWIKWVTSVQLDDRPWWLQLPFPLE